jgi:hypothetical protein
MNKIAFYKYILNTYNYIALYRKLLIDVFPEKSAEVGYKTKVLFIISAKGGEENEI